MISAWESGEMPQGCPRVSSWAGPRASNISSISTWQAGWMIQWGFFYPRINSRSYHPLLLPPTSTLGSTGSSSPLGMGRHSPLCSL